MRNSLASPSSPGFSYLLLFKEEYHARIAEGLGPSPTVHAVFSFFSINDLDYRTNLYIKPTRLDDIKQVTIESGDHPIRPKRQYAGWDGDIVETDDEYDERIVRWLNERQRWFEAKDFMYRISNKNYLDYKFS
ncbi:1480_t:CDS:1 [Acaulospora morrowiae]|uniref:1480_t:CDS:1 n=1 Tax=Acaulospora morrowiae TaxID=94023 RepID=A0A9N9BXM1_9GLOM|nr:1480_t:CDS:1 [Acaulospora morrowiae]